MPVCCGLSPQADAASRRAAKGSPEAVCTDDFLFFQDLYVYAVTVIWPKLMQG